MAEQTGCEHITCLSDGGMPTSSDKLFRGFWWTKCVACDQRRIYSSRMFECTVCHVYVHEQCWAFAGVCVARSAESKSSAVVTQDRGCQTDKLTADVCTETTTLRTDAATQVEWRAANALDKDCDTEYWSADSQECVPSVPVTRRLLRRTRSMCTSVSSTVWGLVRGRKAAKGNSAATETAPQTIASNRGNGEQTMRSGDGTVIKAEEVAPRLNLSKNKSLGKLKKLSSISVYMLRCHYADFLKRIADEEGFTLTYTQITDGIPEFQYRVRLDVGPHVSSTIGDGDALHLAKAEAARRCLLYFRKLMRDFSQPIAEVPPTASI